ncbi:hypothetical protein C5S29_07680 [ANME-1 cluster archaeon GoMg3.2]|nr:hypothetical protein [ANME-1 cluster archaeon GoMg3.2]
MATTRRLRYAICLFLGRKEYIRIRPARYQCTHCNGNPTTTQKLQCYEPRSPHTTAYEVNVLRELVKSTVKAFLASIPKRLKKTILAVCSDLYEGYINAAKEVFGANVIIVVDCFYIAKLYRNGKV